MKDSFLANRFLPSDGILMLLEVLYALVGKLFVPEKNSNLNIISLHSIHRIGLYDKLRFIWHTLWLKCYNSAFKQTKSYIVCCELSIFSSLCAYLRVKLTNSSR